MQKAAPAIIIDKRTGQAEEELEPGFGKLRSGGKDTMKAEYTAAQILDALVAHYHESIFVTDGEGNIIFVNELGAERVGVPREKLMHCNVRQLVEEGVYERSTVLMAIETKKESVATLTYKTKNSSVSRSVPVLDEDGNVIMTVTNNMSSEHSREWEEILDRERAVTERLQRELDYLRLRDQSRLVAKSPAMKNVVETINVIAPTDGPVIVLGESGTGKDMMAKMIHERSDRADHAYISVNCAAIPEQLLESELFGYEGGAFTGALAKGKIGLFEAAAGGTIFLDEIGEMPLALQSKLLRALENKEIRRVGGIKNIPIDVRIICATNADLHQMVKEKRFREDLFYRLSVFLIHLPPLCERREDIIPLAENFLKELNEKYGAHKVLSEVAVDTMLKHRWPGNIRELRNVMERIFVVSPGNELIFTPVPTADYSQSVYESVRQTDPEQYDSLRDYMAAAERRYIQQVLDSCDGCVGKTAERLGIHRSVLYRKLHKEKN